MQEDFLELCSAVVELARYVKLVSLGAQDLATSNDLEALVGRLDALAASARTRVLEP